MLPHPQASVCPPRQELLFLVPMHETTPSIQTSGTSFLALLLHCVFPASTDTESMIRCARQSGSTPRSRPQTPPGMQFYKDGTQGTAAIRQSSP